MLFQERAIQPRTDDYYPIGMSYPSSSQPFERGLSLPANPNRQGLVSASVFQSNAASIMGKDYRGGAQDRGGDSKKEYAALLMQQVLTE